MVDQRILSPLAMELCDLDLANLALDYEDYVYWSTLAIEEATTIYFKGKAPSSVLFDGQINFCEMMLNRKRLYYRHSEWEDKARQNLQTRIVELEDQPLAE
jgi:predicted metal-dependent HD superfamily phosphohydrolase